MKTTTELTPSLEDYLETIFILEKKNRVARVKDIAGELNVQMPSVTGALKNLRQKGLVNYERNSFISLTTEGLQIAAAIERKHEILVTFLQDILLLSPEEAQEQGCSIEHVISGDTAQRLNNLSAYLSKHLGGDGPDTDSWRTLLETRRDSE